MFFRGKTAEEAKNDVIYNQLVQIKTLMQEGKLHVDNIDVFCEQGVFNVSQSREILVAGKKCGLEINFHADELHPLNGAEVRPFFVVFNQLIQDSLKIKKQMKKNAKNIVGILLGPHLKEVSQKAGLIDNYYSCEINTN